MANFTRFTQGGTNDQIVIVNLDNVTRVQHNFDGGTLLFFSREDSIGVAEAIEDVADKVGASAPIPIPGI